MPGAITNFEEPATLEQGQKYYLRNQVTNAGSEPATFRQRYILVWEARELIAGSLDLLPGETGTFVLIGGLMPNQDAVFEVYVERGPLWIQDDFYLSTIKLGYGQPYIEIDSINFPESQFPGSTAEITLTLKNTGLTSAYTAIRVTYQWSGEERTTKWIILDPLQIIGGSIQFNMPNQDATLTITLLRLRDSEWITDNFTTITIKHEAIPEPPPPEPSPPRILLIIPIAIFVVSLIGVGAVIVKKRVSP